MKQRTQAAINLNNYSVFELYWTPAPTKPLLDSSSYKQIYWVPVSTKPLLVTIILGSSIYEASAGFQLLQTIILGSSIYEASTGFQQLQTNILDSSICEASNSSHVSDNTGDKWQRDQMTKGSAAHMNFVVRANIFPGPRPQVDLCRSILAGQN